MSQVINFPKNKKPLTLQEEEFMLECPACDSTIFRVYESNIYDTLEHECVSCHMRWIDGDSID